MLFPATDDRPDDNASAAPPEVEPPPMVMPARPSWRAHPGRRRSYARAIERRDRIVSRAGATTLDPAQWGLLVEIARQRNCSLDDLLREIAEMLTGASPDESTRQIWALGGEAALPPAEETDGGCSRVLIRDAGGMFEISFCGKTRSFGKLKGLTILKLLTDRPGEYFSCLDLRNHCSGQAVPRAMVGENEAASRRFGIEEGRSRWSELRGEIEEAEAMGQWDRKKCLEEEEDELKRSLLDQYGGTRGKKAVSTELTRARKSISAAIVYACMRIKRELPELEAHLQENIDKGYFCRYRKIEN